MTNIVTAVLASGTILVEIGESTLSRNASITTFFVLATLARILEVVKELVPMVWGQTVPHFRWCCERRDQAREADKIQVPALGRLQAAPLAVRGCLMTSGPCAEVLQQPRTVAHHRRPGAGPVRLQDQRAGRPGHGRGLPPGLRHGASQWCVLHMAAVPAHACAIPGDCGPGADRQPLLRESGWQVLIDEYVRSFKRVRQRPADFELDDALDEPGEGEHLRLTSVPAQLQDQLTRVSLNGDKAAAALPGKSVGLADAQPHLQPQQHQQQPKGRFNAAMWEQQDGEL